MLGMAHGCCGMNAWHGHGYMWHECMGMDTSHPAWAHVSHHSRVAASNNSNGLLAEDGRSPVADRAGRDPLVPETLVLAAPRELEAAGDGACGDDDGVGGDLPVAGPDLEGALAQLHFSDSLGEDSSPHLDRLLPHVLDEFRAQQSIGKACTSMDTG